MEENAAGGSAGHALSPDLSAEELAILAAERPDLWDEILQHPAVYPGLSEWIEERRESLAALPPPMVTSQDSTPAPEASPAISMPGAQPPRRGSKRIALIAGAVAAALVLAGTGTAIALTGTLDRWFGTSESVEAAVIAEEGEEGFADGIERMWVADSNDFAQPLIGELGQDFTFLRATFTRGSIALSEADLPVATESAIVFNARGEDSRLVMIAAETGETVLDHDLRGLTANCVVDNFAAEETFFCLASHDQRNQTVLLRLTTDGEVHELEFDVSLHRVAVGKDRIVLSSEFGTAVALDRSLRELWRNDKITNGAFAGLDLSGDRTLIRGMDGWTLLGDDGQLLASADVVGPYDGGNGECDALLTGSGKLFVAVAGDDSCVEVQSEDLNWWGFGENLSGISVFTVDGRDYLFSVSDDRSELLEFSESGGQLETVFETPKFGSFLGVVGGDGQGDPLVVVSTADSATSFALDDGEEVVTFGVAGEIDDGRLPGPNLLLDKQGTVLRGGTAYDSLTGEVLWKFAGGEVPNGGWVTDAGLMVLGGGCPECSRAGGSETSSTLTLFAPGGSGGTEVSLPANEEGAENSAEAPEFIPDCPAKTTLLAWAELHDGWLVVCGVSALEPTYFAYQPSDGSSPLYSVGYSDPTGAAAKGAVQWDDGLGRYIAEMEDGLRITLDYDLGTLTARDEGEQRTIEQQRLIRYVFVPMGEQVRTLQEVSDSEGAFDVKAPEDTAEDQIRYMIEVLDSAYQGREMVKDALPKLKNCTASAGGYGDSVTSMEAVRDNRARLLESLASMPVDRIPEGQALLDDLTEAITYSHTANVEYVAWANAANARGCASVSSAGERAAAASDAPKERFASRWNRVVAGPYGVRTFDGWYI